MKRSINKRLLRWLPCLMLVSLFVPALPAHAEEECWVLQEVLVDTHGDVYQKVYKTLTYKEYGNVRIHSSSPPGNCRCGLHGVTDAKQPSSG